MLALRPLVPVENLLLAALENEDAEALVVLHGGQRQGLVGELQVGWLDQGLVGHFGAIIFHVQT